MRPSEFQQRNPVKLDISRSKFCMEPRWTGCFNSYELVPIFTYTDVMPGDTFKVSTSFVIRMSTPIAPIMDDLWIDVAFYFVPHELILSRSYMSPSTSDSNHSWKAFIGAQDSLLNMPVPDSSIQLPHMQVLYSGYKTNGIADCMGIPRPESASNQYFINCLAPLAFMAVFNENYREPNTENPGVFSIQSDGSVTITWDAVGLSSNNAWSDAYLPHVCRFHGYFGSCLPWPQRNLVGVALPLGDAAPIMAASTLHSTGTYGVAFGDEGKITAGDHNLVLSGDGTSKDSVLSYHVSDDYGSGETFNVVNRTNLFADLANASAVSINTFRLAVQEQRWYEALARGGNRIDELTAALFGVMPKDAGGNQPEYLGGKRIPIQVSQVNVTANGGTGTGALDKVGQTGAFSLTSDSDYYFTKSFDKWGSIIGVACVRYRDSFGHSLNRQFTRHERFDWYFPQFGSLGEQPVYKHEISVSEITVATTNWPTSSIFGYQEAWADFRTIPDVVTGLVRPGKSLDHWTYANNFSGSFSSTVTASNYLAGFLKATFAYKAVDRTLQVGSSASGFQFLAQFQHSIVAVRPMPLYSIPGLVDHH